MPVHSAQHYLSAYDRCLAQFSWAFQQLHLPVPRGPIQAWASLIVQSVSSPSRYFHGPDHTLRLAASMAAQGDGLAVLAALFHDAIYSHVDEGLPQAAATLLQGQVRFEPDGMLFLPTEDLVQRLVLSLFELPELEPAQQAPDRNPVLRLPLERSNEFLSALLAAECLSPVLSLGQVAAVVIAIEATIPFRQEADGQRPSDRRFKRLQRANQAFGLGLSKADMRDAICRSVHLTNADLASFAAEDPTYFLDQTWLILPELTPALRNPRQYRAVDYRRAVRRMEEFLNGLRADEIFQRFHGIPETEEYHAMVQRTRHNLAVGSLYLETKVVAIAILEVLTHYHSPPLPMQELLSPTSSFCHTSAWEQQFPVWRLSQPLHSTTEVKVLQIAEEGRITPCSFDLVRSPLATLLIRSIGFERIKALRQQSELYFEGHISGEELLCKCEAKVIQTLSQTLPRFVQG